MSKFENKVQEMNTGALKVLQEDLQKRVALDKLGFGKRALNIFKAVLGMELAGIGVNYLNARRLGFSGLLDGMKAAGREIEQLSDSASAGDFFKSDSAGARLSKQALIVSAVSVGAIIPVTMMLNRSSKRKLNEKLSFVDAELARRDAQENAIDTPQITK